MKKWRVGQFEIRTSEISKDPAAFEWIFKGLVILSIEGSINRDVTAYMAWGEQFDLIGYGATPPYYLPIKVGTGAAKWQKRDPIDVYPFCGAR